MDRPSSSPNPVPEAPSRDWNVGFYTHPRFWVGDRVVAAAYNTVSEAASAMQECEYCHQTEDWTLRVRRDGMILLRVESIEASISQLRDGPARPNELVRAWNRYLDCANRLYLLLDCATLRELNLGLFEVVTLTPGDVARVELRDGRPVASGLGRGEFWDTPFGTPMLLPSIANTILQEAVLGAFRRVIPAAVFDALAHDFAIALSSNRLVERLAAIGKGVAEYRAGNYAVGLVLSWFVIEEALRQEWQAYLDGKQETYPGGMVRLNSDRIARLTKGPEYTISIIADVLELSDLLPFDLYRQLKQLGPERNAVVHEGERDIAAERCRQAIEVALRMATRHTPLDLSPDLEQYVRGL